jgi:sigma-B regulation protein RsbU (phosphoserine phosphatase)
LGGDCFSYYWIDDDHLLVKLIDVSGHGLEPALLAASVHNLIRSGSLSRETLLVPEAVLTELNHLFAMEHQNDHYLTMWYGIYEASTRTLRYASAGAPPALAFNLGTGLAVAVTEIFTTAAPVGAFEDTVFSSGTYHVPPGCRMLIYSDGASEINLADGKQLTVGEFKKLATKVAASSGWSLGDLIDELRALTPSDAFEDDCSLIQLQFD